MKVKDLLILMDTKYIDVKLYIDDDFIGLYDRIIKHDKTIDNREIEKIEIMSEFSINIFIK